MGSDVTCLKRRRCDGIRSVERADRELVCALANRCQRLVGFQSGAFDDGDWKMIFKWAQNQPPIGTLRGQLAIARILQDVGRHFRSSSSTERVDLRGSENLVQIDNRLVADALQLIEQLSSDPKLRLKSIASKLGVCGYHLEHMFKRHGGGRFTAHVRNARIHHSVRLLEEGRLSIKQIAAEVGFLHVSSFDRTFRKVCGMKPTEWLRCRNTVEHVSK
jgi:AraC-like DNA-binding protein